MLFIYLMEGSPQFAPKVARIQKQMEVRGDKLVTSVFTLGEVLAGPRKLGAQDGINAVKAYFQSGVVELLPFNWETSDRYSALRSTFNVTQADAIHLATAAIAGVDAFVTNDRELQRLRIPGIAFVIGLDGKVF